ncbi:MAG: beta-lactamase family protein [Steroidobacteraceae bacterium]|nr:beta-lactamase family protein [Steroidobacteraceae bacterium]
MSNLSEKNAIASPGRRGFLLRVAVSAACAGILAACELDDSRARRRRIADEAAQAAVKGGLVGAVIASVRADAADSFIAVAGVRRIGGREPIRATDTFSIGSNTKAVTSMVIAALVAQGRVTWDTRIVEALPELAGTMRIDYAAITMEQLLAHRGGFPAFTGDGDDEERFLADLADTTGDLPESLSDRRRFFAAWLTRQEPPAEIVPGRDFLYSNAGYAIAATMVEALTGESFESLFEAVVASVIGVSGRWRMPSEVPTALPPEQPAAHEGPRDSLDVYLPDEESLAVEPWLRVLAPSGYWACSPEDYLRWLRLHVRALRGEKTALPADYVRRLGALAPGDYAMGWQGESLEGRPILYHTGHVPGFMCEAVVDQKGTHAVFGFSNTGHMNGDGSSWVLALIDRELAKVFRDDLEP